MTSARSRAEQKFAKLTRRSADQLDERAQAEHDSLEKTARLRALRLARETAAQPGRGPATTPRKRG